jgi:OOP family OmpA-OmpF porin
MKNKACRLLLLLTFLMGKISFAQTEDKPWNVGVYGGKSSYRGDLSHGGTLGLGGILHPSKAFYGFGAVSVSRYLNSDFDLNLNFSYGEAGYHSTEISRFVAKSTNINLGLRYKIVKKEGAKFVPFILAGVGMNHFVSKVSWGYRNTEHTVINNFKVKGNSFVIQGGIGADYKITPAVSIRYFVTLDYLKNDQFDGLRGGHVSDILLQNNLGITYSFGTIKKVDTDKDGVSDKKDKCPGTMVGALVDKTGCIMDKDKDGTADNLDACPEVLGVAYFKGCPDTDADSVQDAEDACPQVAGKKEFKGCPDSDNDGIEDSKDKCPTIAGINKMEGCPSDTDGDGIYDNDDKCPNVVGVKDNRGCPAETAAQVAAKQTKNLGTNVKFGYGKSRVNVPSFIELNDVITIMNDNPTYQLEIDGHADSRDSEEKNQIISEKRAEAVKQYLIKKGVPENRMMTKGFGESKPIESNETAAGRAANRRVQLVLIY